MKTILNQVQKLTPDQRKELILQIKQSLQTQPDTIRDTEIVCPDCSSDLVVKFGTYGKDKRGRFLCKNTECERKTFTILTGTWIDKIQKKNLWNEFIELMIEGKSLRFISEKLNLSNQTVFDWRHKVLVSFEKTFTKKFKGIVEMDDIFLDLNQKGRRKNRIIIPEDRDGRGIDNFKVSVMVTSDRYGSMDMETVKLGRITKNSIEKIVKINRFNKDNIICSDKHRSISCYVKSIGLKHETIHSSKKEYVRGVYHVNKVNSLTNEFRNWLKSSFGNVSTKYLQNYLRLFVMTQVLKGNKEMVTEFMRHSLVDNNSWLKSKIIEPKYQRFLKVG
jgi:transposase-like protein